ncbi:ArnT family glycosyltransferase [Mesorhizobium sp. AaZ16]|uniref:ArnT family glycosyltransferase n=1 Tax=Mesorhizobium sp. AaZ16 TaxID=3402289 RepID=UPI00374FD35E
MVVERRGLRMDPWLGAILIIAALARMEDLTQPLVDAFSWRESSTAMMADNFQTRSWNVLYPEVSWTGPGPSYQGREFQIVSYLAALLYQIFGWHDWFGRLIGAAFGTLTVFFLYKLTERVWGIWDARAAAFVLSILPGAVFIDRSYLPDPAMLTLITAGVWLFCKYADSKRLIWLIFSCVSLTLGVLAKLPGIAIAIPLIYVLVERISSKPPGIRLNNVMAVAFFGLVSLAGVFAYYAWAIYIGKNYPPYHVAGSGYLWSDGLPYYVSRWFLIPELFSLTTLWYMTFPFLVLSAIGLMHGPPRLQEQAPTTGRWLFHAWLFGAFLVFLFAAREIVTNPWNLHVFSVPLAAFAGRGLIVATGLQDPDLTKFKAMARIGVAALFLLLLGSRPALDYLKTPYAYAGYELGTELSALTKPGELIIAVSSTVGDPVAIYYSRRRGWVFPPGGGQSDWSVFIDDSEAIEKLRELRSQGAKWFGVTRNAKDSKGRKFFDHHKGLKAFLEKNSTQVKESKNYVIYELK